MKCKNHSDREAIAVCQKHEAGFCQECCECLDIDQCCECLDPKSTVSSEPSVSSGRCPEIVGKKKWRCPELRRVQGYPAPDVVRGGGIG